MSDSSYFSEDTVKTKIGYWGLAKRLWPFLRPYKYSFLFVLLMMLSLAGVERLLPTLFGYAIDAGILPKNLHVIYKVAVLYLVLEVVRVVLIYGQSYVFSIAGNRVLYDVRKKLIAHTQKLPLSFFDRTPAGRVVTRLTNDVLSLGDLFTEGLVQVFYNAIAIVAILIAMLLISVKLTALTLFLAPFVLWLAFWLSHKIQLVLRESKRRMAQINAFVAENLGGINVLHLHNQTGRSLARFQDLSLGYKLQQLKSVTLYAVLWPLFTLFFGIALAIALIYGGHLTKQGILPIGLLVAFSMHVQDFFPPLRGIMERYQQFQNSLTGGERIFTMLDELEEVDASRPLEIARVKGNIEITNLNFRYSKDSPLVLRNFNVNIKAGESVAIVGRTGSGKTTLIGLLQRLYDIEDGNRIRIDDIPITDIPRLELRRHVGVVQQDPFTFRGTIKDNISLFNPAITDEIAIEALKRAHAWPIVERMGGLDSFIQERGANLSTGERQLLAFARILAFDPDILILDEATANIDSENENRIQQATVEMTSNRTSLIIAHRLSTILNCDRILVLENGELREQGTHAELLKMGGIYHNLYLHQFRNEHRASNHQQATTGQIT